MPNRRPRGYQPRWKPRARTSELLAAVDRVLERYAAQLPLTIRQVWYSLISDVVMTKEERTYKQSVELLGMARRSGRIPWEALRDDTEIRAEPVAYEGPDDFRVGLRRAALEYRLDRQAGQPVRLETAGMVPQLVAVADPYGVPVGSGSGFNALPAKRGAALRAAAGGHRVVRVFVVSDWDPSGVHLFSALAEDVTAFAAVDAPGNRAPEQIMDVSYASKTLFTPAIYVAADNPDLSAGQVAQAMQVPAYPDTSTQWKAPPAS
ncbi:hypothetical protein ACIOML_23525 [Streptomyces anulatus]